MLCPALRGRPTVKKEAAYSQGKEMARKVGGCGHLGPAQPGSHLLSNFVSGSRDSPPTPGSMIMHASCDFARGTTERVPVTACVVCHP